MKVLVACEESQVVTKAFRAKGHEAYSCDLMPCSGGRPEWHLQQDVSPLLKEKWDIVIAFPPCTYLCVTGNSWFNIKKYGEKATQRYKDKDKAIKFFMKFANCVCPRVAIENPIGCMSILWKTPSQIIQPYYFGDKYQKTTCLWLKNLPLLTYTKIVNKGEQIKFKNGGAMPKWYAVAWGLPKEERSKLRSRTFPGIAKAMATQWGTPQNRYIKIF